MARNSRGAVEDTQDLNAPWPGGIWPAEEVPRRARTSVWATVGLVVGLVAVGTTLTGLLVPEGFVLGVLGAVVSVIGFVAASRPEIAGQVLAALGLLAGLAAAGLAAAATTGHLSWLDSHTDAVLRLHGWLVVHWPWLDR